MKLFNEVKDNSGSLLWHKHRRGTEKSKEGGRVAADISLLWGTASGLKKYQAYLSSAPLHRMVFNSSKVPDNICLESPCWSPWWSAHLHPTRSGGFWDRWVGHTTFVAWLPPAGIDIHTWLVCMTWCQNPDSQGSLVLHLQCRETVERNSVSGFEINMLLFLIVVILTVQWSEIWLLLSETLSPFITKSPFLLCPPSDSPTLLSPISL